MSFTYCLLFIDVDGLRVDPDFKKWVLEWERLYSGKVTVIDALQLWEGITLPTVQSMEAGAIRIFCDTKNTLRCNHYFDYVTSLC